MKPIDLSQVLKQFKGLWVALTDSDKVISSNKRAQQASVLKRHDAKRQREDWYYRLFSGKSGKNIRRAAGKTPKSKYGRVSQ